MFDFHTHLGDNLSNSLINSSSKDEFQKISKLNLDYYSYGIIAPNKLDYSSFENYIISDNRAMIGEIGLDDRYENQDEQLTFFNKALSLAKDLNRSFTLHNVGNINLLLKTLKKYPQLPPFIFHNFTSSCEIAKEIYKLNGYISLSKRSTKTKHFEKLLNFDFLLETDLPTSPFQREEIKLLYKKVSDEMKIDINKLEEKLDDRITIFTS